MIDFFFSIEFLQCIIKQGNTSHSSYMYFVISIIKIYSVLKQFGA